MGNCFRRLGHGGDSRELEKVPKHGRRPRHSPWMQTENYDNGACKSTRSTVTEGDQQTSGNDIIRCCLVEGGGGKGRDVRVKIVLTKEAAARLLACSGGSTEKMLEHVAGELRKMDTSSRDAIGLGHRHRRWRPALEAIPEREPSC